MKLYSSRLESPLGTLTLVWDERALRVLHLGDSTVAVPPDVEQAAVPAWLRGPVVGYFEGYLTGLDRLPILLEGTAFQRRVWQALRRVPAGTTVSYKRLAEMAGCPNGSRAVGSANGANPIAIVIPCHRVIAADGSLGGYGGGLDRKEWLLRHEWQAEQPFPERLMARAPGLFRS